MRAAFNILVLLLVFATAPVSAPSTWATEPSEDSCGATGSGNKSVANALSAISGTLCENDKLVLQGTGAIQDLQIVSLPALDSRGMAGTVIRQFQKNGVRFAVFLDEENFSTVLLPLSCLMLQGGRPVAQAPSSFSSALDYATVNPLNLHQDGYNDGVTQARIRTDSKFLTVDLCPAGSNEPLTRQIFLDAEKTHPGGKVPIGVSVTGKWMENHPGDLAWLKEQERQGKLAITWINHTYDHAYKETRQDGREVRTLMLEPGKSFEKEVLETERTMIQNGLTPSVFFRFPGLVSSKPLMEDLRKMSLIPLGSNAWLALGADQLPKDGSIILVHGNGHEESGVRILSTYIQHHKELRLGPASGLFLQE